MPLSTSRNTETAIEITSSGMAGRIALFIFLSLSACHVATLLQDTGVSSVTEDSWQKKFLEIPTAAGAKEHLRYYTSMEHSAGDVYDVFSQVKMWTQIVRNCW
jgi:hypothetical protein